MASRNARPIRKTKPVRRPIAIPRRFGRTNVDCEAVLAFPGRNARPRVKARLFQLGQGGCGLALSEHPHIGEECLVWASNLGRRYLGISGRVAWIKSVYRPEASGGRQTALVGIEFHEPIELPAELLVRTPR